MHQSQFTVTGYPVPTVQCEDLQLDDGIQISKEPQGGVMLYRLQIPSIQQNNLRRYVCRAENPYGSAALPVKFTGKLFHTIWFSYLFPVAFDCGDEKTYLRIYYFMK